MGRQLSRLDMSMMLTSLTNIDRISLEVNQMFIEEFAQYRGASKGDMTIYVQTAWNYLNTLQFDSCIQSLSHIEKALAESSDHPNESFRKVDISQLVQVVNCLKGLGYGLDPLSRVSEFVRHRESDLLTKPGFLNKNAEELLRTVYELGVLPAHIKSEASIDALF